MAYAADNKIGGGGMERLSKSTFISDGIINLENNKLYMNSLSFQSWLFADLGSG
jgi:hypothetical protein